MTLVFDLLSYTQLERAYAVWHRILAGIFYIEQMIETSYSSLDLLEQFRSYTIDLILRSYVPHDDSTDGRLDQLYRGLILSAACQYGLDHCVRHAELLFQQWFNDPSNNTIEPNQRELVYCTNVRLGGRVPFQFLLRQYRTSNDPQEMLRLRSALICTRDVASIRYLLNIHFDSQAGIIPRHDLLSGIRSICRNTVAICECWSFVRSQWKHLLQNHGESIFFPELIKDVTSQFNTKQQLDEFELFSEQTADKVRSTDFFSEEDFTSTNRLAISSDSRSNQCEMRDVFLIGFDEEP
jgi:hypothetical protein